jgi:glycosyltransferase 2 family protein
MAAASEVVRIEERWRPALLTIDERGRRNRRTIDGVLLAFGSIVLGLAAAIAYSAKPQDEQVARALGTVFGWAEVFWRVAFVSAIVLALLVAVDALVRLRWLLVRDIVVALAVEFGLGMLLGEAVISDWTPLKPHLLARWGFPELRLAGVTAILVVSGPELVRPARRLAFALVLLAATGVVALGAALPSAALAGLSFGLAGAAAVRLAFGTAAGVPPSARIRTELDGLSVQTTDLQPADRQRVGAAEYVGHDAAGKPLNVRVLGRDAQDTQRLARRWRSFAYRDPRHMVAVGRVEQVEHEALVTLMAASAGVRVPRVVTAAMGSYGDALIVTDEPDVAPLEEAEDASDPLLRALWQEVARLRAARISHGRLNLRSVAVVDGKPVLIDLEAAALGAPQTALDIDVAELLVSSTVLVGPKRALAAAIHGVGGEAIAGALPYLERAALTPHTRDLARRNDVAIKELREAAGEATNTKLPELADVRRVRARDFLYTGLIALAAYLLITKLAKIGFGTIYHELKGSDLVWVGVALIIVQFTYVSQAISLRGAVETPLPLLPTVVLKCAAKFLNLTVPGSAGTIALNIRFLQKLGVPTGPAVASGAIDGIIATVIEVLLVLAVIPLVHLHLNTKQISGAVPSGTFIAIIFVALVLAVVIVIAVPKLRNKIVPSVKTAFAALWAVARSGRKLGELFGATLATEVLYALALGAACLAYGVHLALWQLIAVNVIASTLAGLVPVPGGIGAAEAALAGGLVAIGIPEAVAFAIAITDRLCTYYLPPISGYFALRWLQRKGFV